MPQRLASADSIELVDENFKNHRWEAAAKDILEFWDDGVRTFVEMDKRGDWSRSHYSNVFDEHFVMHANGKGPTSATEIGSLSVDELPADHDTVLKIYREIYREVYREGFRDGINWAMEERPGED